MKEFVKKDSCQVFCSTKL